MNLINKDVTVGAVVATFPQAAKVFSDFRIDYCCGGHRLLSDVVREQGIDESKLAERLKQAQEERSGVYSGFAGSFTEMSPGALTAYIEDTHHAYLREALPQTEALLNTILRAHGKNHRELFEVYALYGRLKSELEQHLLKEEDLLFPALSAEGKNRDEITKLTAEIIKEHEAAGEILSKLREVTNEYELPSDACESYRAAFDKLEELENDLHQHIHLENNILLRKYYAR